jgi:hypothetical protein
MLRWTSPSRPTLLQGFLAVASAQRDSEARPQPISSSQKHVAAGASRAAG